MVANKVCYAVITASGARDVIDSSHESSLDRPALNLFRPSHTFAARKAAQTCSFSAFQSAFPRFPP
jgi:hypothetical protein